MPRQSNLRIYKICVRSILTCAWETAEKHQRQNQSWRAEKMKVLGAVRGAKLDYRLRSPILREQTSGIINLMILTMNINNQHYLKLETLVMCLRILWLYEFQRFPKSSKKDSTFHTNFLHSCFNVGSQISSLVTCYQSYTERALHIC